MRLAEFELPWPPSLNKSARKFGCCKYRKQVLDEWQWPCTAFVEGERLAVTIVLYPPNARRFDIDNRVKPILDALTGVGLWTDDWQVDDLRVSRRPHRIEPCHACAVVTVREIEHD
jgi:crossover junction endodeoxyribonuclease RusA